MLFQKITDDMKSAMKAKDTEKLAAVRSIFAAVKTEAINSGEREEISDEVCMKVIKKQVKQRKDSIDQFTKAGREDLAETEKKELVILEEYLPEMLSEEEIEKVVSAVKAELGDCNMGQLMGAVMKRLQGQEADGAVVRKIVQTQVS